VRRVKGHARKRWVVEGRCLLRFISVIWYFRTRNGRNDLRLNRYTEVKTHANAIVTRVIRYFEITIDVNAWNYTASYIIFQRIHIYIYRSLFSFSIDYLPASRVLKYTSDDSLYLRWKYEKIMIYFIQYSRGKKL